MGTGYEYYTPSCSKTTESNVVAENHVEIAELNYGRFLLTGFLLIGRNRFCISPVIFRPYNNPNTAKPSLSGYSGKTGKRKFNRGCLLHG